MKSGTALLVGLALFVSGVESLAATVEYKRATKGGAFMMNQTGGWMGEGMGGWMGGGVWFWPVGSLLVVAVIVILVVRLTKK